MGAEPPRYGEDEKRGRPTNNDRNTHNMYYNYCYYCYCYYYYYYYS